MSITIENINAINFSSIVTTGTAFRNLSADTTEIGAALDFALELSETKAYRLSRGVLSTVSTIENYETDAKNLINWGKTGTSQQRQIVAKAIRNDGGQTGNLFMVHAISEMTRNDARAFMSDYLTSGGDTKAVADWLAVAGKVLRRHNAKSNDTAGVVVDVIGDGVDWLVDKVEDAVDSIVEAIEAVVDAVINAGKSLVELVGDVISWAVEEVGDLVQALLEVGKSIAEILQAAWEFGVDGLKKFVKAVIDIGKEIGEILVHAVEQTAAALKDFTEALIAAAVSVGRILEWAADQLTDIAGKIVESLIDIGKSVGTILYSAFQMTASIVGSITKALISIGKTVAELLVTAITQPANLFNEVVRALNEIGQTIATLYDEVVGAVADGVEKMTKALIAIGKTVTNVISWAIDKAADIVKDVLKGIIEAGKTILDILSSIASRALSVVKKIVQGLFDIGRKILSLISDVISLGLNFAKKFVTAIKELAGALIQFAKEVVKLTYKAASSLVKTLLDVGLKVGEILGTVIGASYWVFRRMVNGILEHLGPVGDILDWTLTQVENAASELWHDALLAIRYAEGKLKDAIEWAVEKSEEAFEAILNAWESIEEDLIDFYRAATELVESGVDNVFEYIGKMTVKLENSVTYVLTYLEKDFIPGVRDFVKGLLDAGYVIQSLFVNIANINLQAFTEVIAAALDFGVTLTELLAETMKNPSELLPNFLQAAEALGQSLEDIYQNAIDNTGEDYLEAITNAWNDLEKPIQDMLSAIVEVSAAALTTVLASILSRLGTYRAMTAREIEEARKIYGNTFDYSRIFFSQESLLNTIIFEVQDWFSKNEDSRAFVTNSLVNFDVNDGPIDFPTMIHELSHVWQFEETGAFYMAEAIHAQVVGDGYNYGYTDAGNGDGGENALLDIFTDNPTLNTEAIFELFNREQQGQIIMHYYVRRYDESRPVNEYEAWQPFQNLVFS
jgi:phage-related protein